MCAIFYIERNKDRCRAHIIIGSGLELVIMLIKKGRLSWFGDGDTSQRVRLMDCRVTDYRTNGH